MSNVLAFPGPAQPDEAPVGRLACPRCGAEPEQRIDTDIDADGVTIAAAVCVDGHLFVTQWEASR